MKEFVLTLTEAEVNLVLNALAARPFQDVFQTIPKIQSQCNAQLKPVEIPPAEVE